MANDAKKSGLEGLYVLSLSQKSLEIVIDLALRELETLVLVLQLLDGSIELLDLAVGKVKLLLSSLDVSDHVRLWLVSSVQKSLVQLDFSLLILDLLLQLTDLLHEALSFLLLLLESVGKQQALLDTSLGSCGGLSNGMDQSISYFECTITRDSVILCHMHDGLVQFFLNEFIVGKTLLCDSKLSFDICIALSCATLKLVVL